MNLKDLLYLTTILILISLWACNNETDSAAEKVSWDDLSIHQIPAVVARPAINRYQEYVDTVTTVLSAGKDSIFQNPQKTLIYGAQVDREELRKVLLRTDTTDTVYIMMGILDGVGRTAADSTELIFAAEVWDDKLEAMSWKFFDFTLPCPTACPQFADFTFLKE